MALQQPCSELVVIQAMKVTTATLCNTVMLGSRQEKQVGKSKSLVSLCNVCFLQLSVYYWIITSRTPCKCVCLFCLTGSATTTRRSASGGKTNDEDDDSNTPQRSHARKSARKTGRKIKRM